MLVESGKALDTAVCITVASDDDTFVKEYDNNTHTRLLLHLFFSFFWRGGGGELWAKTKSMCKQKKRKKENMYKASISRSNDTENYLPC